MVGLRGFKLNPALVTYFTEKPPPRQARRRGSRRERRVRKRLDAETIDRLVAEGSTSAELGQRYGLGRNSVLALVRQTGERVRHPRLNADETARLIELYEAGLSQKEIGERLSRSPSAIWHCLRRIGIIDRSP